MHKLLVYELYLSKAVTKKISQASEVGRRNGISSLRNMKLHRVSEELWRLGRESRVRVRDVQGLSVVRCIRLVHERTGVSQKNMQLRRGKGYDF